MTLAFVLGAGINDGLSTGQGLYDHSPGVRQFYADVAEWTGFTLDQVLTEPMPERPHQLRWSLGEIRHAALLIALHDVLAESGIHPTAVSGMSLGALVGSCLAGAITREEFFRMRARTREIPERPPGLAEEGLAMWMAPDTIDVRAVLAGQPDVFPAVAYGRTADGSSQLTILSGHRSALDAFAANLPPDQVQQIENRPFAAHSPLRSYIMDVMGPVIEAAEFHDPQLPLYSCLEPRRLRTGAEVQDLFLRNTVEPVSFVDLCSAMAEQDITLALALGQFMPAGFLEMPFPMLNVRDLDDVDEARSAIGALGLDVAARGA